MPVEIQEYLSPVFPQNQEPGPSRPRHQQRHQRLHTWSPRETSVTCGDREKSKKSEDSGLLPPRATGRTQVGLPNLVNMQDAREH